MDHFYGAFIVWPFIWSLCVSPTLSASPHLPFVRVQKKSLEPSYFQPTSFSLSHLQVQSKERKINIQLYLGGMYCISSILIYSEAIHHLTFRCACTASPISWCILVYRRYIAQLHRVMKSWWRYEHSCKGRTLYQWIKLCTMLNFKEGSLAKLCDRFYLVRMMTEGNYFWYSCEKNTSPHVFLFVSLDGAKMIQNRQGFQLLIVYPWVFKHNTCSYNGWK